MPIVSALATLDVSSWAGIGASGSMVEVPFQIRRGGAIGLVIDAELLLADGKAHWGWLKTMSNDAMAALYEADGKRLSDRVCAMRYVATEYLDNGTEADPKVIQDIKNILDDIIRWRRGVQFYEVFTRRQQCNRNKGLPTQNEQRAPLVPTSISINNGLMGAIPYAPAVRSPTFLPPSAPLAFDVPRVHPSRNENRNIHLPYTQARVASLAPGSTILTISRIGASLSNIMWGQDPVRQVISLIDMLPSNLPAWRLQGQINSLTPLRPPPPRPTLIQPRRSSSSSSASAAARTAHQGAAAAYPPEIVPPFLSEYPTMMSDRVVGVQVLSATKVVILYQETGDAIMLDNRWNTEQPPPGYETAVLQLVAVDEQ